MMRAICSLAILFSVVSAQSTKPALLSPCPDVFTYESPGSGEKPEPGVGKWYGVVTLSTDIPLYALWLNIIVDNKADILGNWIGEVTTEDNHNFKIENTKLKIMPDSPLSVRFFIQYNSQQASVPKLQSILFNGREICNVDASQTIVERPASNNYDVNNGISKRLDKTTTTARPITTTKGKNQYGQQTTQKSIYWTQAKAQSTQATTEKPQTTTNKAQLTPIWAWTQPKNDNTQQVKSTSNQQAKNKDQTQANSGSNSQSKSQWNTKSDNNQQRTSSVTRNDQAQEIRQQTSQVWSQPKVTNYQQTKAEKSQITTERNTQIKVDNTEQAKPNKQSSYSTYQTTTENTYNKVQAWSSAKVDDSQQTKVTNNQRRTEDRFQVSSTSQYYAQPNGNDQQDKHKNGLETSFGDNSYVEQQNTQQRKSGSLSNREQYDTSDSSQKRVSTDNFQITGVQQQQVRPIESDQVRLVDALPVRDDGRPKKRKEAVATSSRPSEIYSYTQEQPKDYEYGVSKNSDVRDRVNDRNVDRESSLSEYQLTEVPIVDSPPAPVVEDYYNENPPQEEEDDDSNASIGLPVLYIPHLRPEAECGKVTKKPPPYLPYGSTTSEGQWPWQAALYQQQTVDFKYICGGTLVSHRHIITAAHCVTRKKSRREVNKNTLTVYLGKFNLRTSIDGVQVKFVSRIIIHPDYNATIFSRDLAILVLREAATFTDWVRPACLWPENQIGRRYIVGQKGSVVGWGFEMSGAPRAELNLLEMPVVDQETCISSFIDFYQKFTSEYTYCAGYNDDTSVCNGDSGGGMVFKRGNTWYLRGIASLSVARPNEYRCDPKHYVIFTDIAKFLPWIEEHID